MKGPSAVLWQRVTRPDSFLPSPSAVRAQASRWLAPRPHPIDIWKPSRSPNKQCACLMKDSAQKVPQFRSGGLGAQPGPEGLDPKPGPTRWSGLTVRITLPSRRLPHAGAIRVLLSVSWPSLWFGSILSPLEQFRTVCSSSVTGVADVTCPEDCCLGSFLGHRPLSPLYDLRNRQLAQSCSFSICQCLRSFTDSSAVTVFLPSPTMETKDPVLVHQLWQVEPFQETCFAEN